MTNSIRDQIKDAVFGVLKVTLAKDYSISDDEVRDTAYLIADQLDLDDHVGDYKESLYDCVLAHMEMKGE